MFKGIVKIIERKKRLHCGYAVRVGAVVKMASICNCTWTLDDKVYEAHSDEVTCKTCQKLLEKATEDGRVTFGKK